jgi:hypothetical protein
VLATVTRSGRQVNVPEKLNLHQCHLDTQNVEPVEYGIDLAKVIANHVCAFNALMMNGEAHTEYGYVIANTFSLKERTATVW